MRRPGRQKVGRLQRHDLFDFYRASAAGYFTELKSLFQLHTEAPPVYRRFTGAGRTGFMLFCLFREERFWFRFDREGITIPDRRAFWRKDLNIILAIRLAGNFLYLHQQLFPRLGLGQNLQPQISGGGKRFLRFAQMTDGRIDTVL